MMRLVTFALVAVPVAAWFVREYRRSDVDGYMDIFDARARQLVREEIAAADAAWDKHVTEDVALGNGGLDPLLPGSERTIEALRAELDNPRAVAQWLGVS